MNQRTAIQAGLILAAAWAFYFLFWPEAPTSSPDSPSYLRLAQDILRLRLTELPVRTPGFPLLLVLTGSAQQAGRLFFFVSLGLHMAAVALIAKLLDALKAPHWAVIGLVASSVLPPFVEPAATVATETLSQFMVVLTVYCLWRWLNGGAKAWAAGYCASVTYGLLVRPTYQFLAIALCVAVAAGMWVGMFPALRWRAAGLWMGLAVICSAAAQFGLVWLNYRNFGYAGPTKIATVALSIHTAPVVEDLPVQFADLRAILLRHRDAALLVPDRDHTAKDYLYRALPEVTKYYGGDERRAFRELNAAFVYLIKTKPMSYFGDVLKAFGLFVMPNECELATAKLPRLRFFWALLQLGQLLAYGTQLVAVGGAGLFMFPRLLRFQFWSEELRRPVCAYLFATCVILYTAALSCVLGNGEPRYRQTTDLLILFSMAAGGQIWWIAAHSSWRQKGEEKVLPATFSI